jgi:hypothetical protein
MTGVRERLVLYYLGILDHRHAPALCEFALQCDRFAAVLRQLIVDWLVFTDNQIRFAIADDPDWAAALDALCPAGLPVLLADSVVIDVAHHIDHFAGHFFRSGCITAMLMFLRDGQWRDRQSGNKCRSHSNLRECRSVVC